jgi:DNA-binding Lrp family transcriptional regulator
MDEIDAKILHELQSNSRESNTEIAKRLKISEGTVRKRIDSLVKEGIIARFSTILSTKAGFMAFVFIRTDTHTPTAEIVKKLRHIEGTGIVYETAGHHDIVLRAATSSAEAFNDLIEQIRAVNGVVETQSLTVLKVS